MTAFFPQEEGCFCFNTIIKESEYGIFRTVFEKR